MNVHEEKNELTEEDVENIADFLQTVVDIVLESSSRKDNSAKEEEN